MKSFGSLLIAVCAVPAVSAFVATAPAFKSVNVALKSSVRETESSESFNSYFDYLNNQNINTNNYTPASARRSTAAKDTYTRELEEKLKNLEKSMGIGKQPQSFSPVGGGIAAEKESATKMNDNSLRSVVQGDSLKTWSIKSLAVDKVYIRLQTEGRPLDAAVELWQGPDNTPQKFRVYNEDGSVRPFSCVMMTPSGPNTLAIRNTGPMEFPMMAAVSSTEVGAYDELISSNKVETGRTIQGGALRTYPFDSYVESVQVLLNNDGRPLNARVELLQGPNNNKQVIEIFSEDGNVRPFFVVIETPGSGNVVRVVNTSPVEFPLTASVEPYLVSDLDVAGENDVVIGGDSDRGSAKW